MSEHVAILYGRNSQRHMNSTDISDDDKDKFDEFFKVRRNVIFERVQFNRRVQQVNKSVEQFITFLIAWWKIVLMVILKRK